MADAAVFYWVCDELEKATSLNRLEARGTVRLAMKQAGFEPSSVDSKQMQTILEKLMPAELESRGIDEAAALCSKLAGALASAELGGAAPGGESPEEIFRRLGGGS
jgi:hypothetical protein